MPRLGGQPEEGFPDFPPVPELNVPFNQVIKPAQSLFVVPVPRSFASATLPNGKTQKRKFYFSDLKITPDFYSAHADELNMDSEAENQTPVKLKYRMRYTFSERLFFLPGKEEPNKLIHNGMIEFYPLLKGFNDYSESLLRVGLKRAPFFIDWCSTQGDVNYETAIPLAAQLTYGEEYDPRVHYNALGASVRSLPKANNFLFPTTTLTDADYRATIRLRLWIAPNTRLHWSNANQLEYLGFSMTQFPPRDSRSKQYHIDNPFLKGYRTVTALGVPGLARGLNTNTRLYCSPITYELYSEELEMEIEKVRLKDDLDVEEKFKLSTLRLMRNSNVDVSFRLDLSTNTFSFVFPAQTDLVLAVVYCNKDLAMRLGYGPTTRISKESVPRPVVPSSQATLMAAEVKSKTLVQDTGNVFVTVDNVGSMLTSGTRDYFMAMLYPISDGTLETKPLCYNPPSVYLPATSGTGGSAANVNMVFNLFKFDYNGEPVPFDWKNAANICGLLRAGL